MKTKHLSAEEEETKNERREQKKRNKRKMKVTGASVKKLQKLLSQFPVSKETHIAQ